MTTKKWFVISGLLLLCLALLTGCGKKEGTQASDTKEVKPATAATPIDPSTAATVSGVVQFSGTAPKPVKIDMSQDPACKGNNVSETVVVDNGNLENAFVYVKDGLGDRTFDT